MTSYIADRKERIQNKELKDLALFGQLGGVLFFIIGYSRFIRTISFIPSILCKILMLLGIILFLAGVIFPSGISWFYKGFSLVGNSIGQVVFSILLTIIYILLIVPIGVIIRRKKKDIMLYEWEDSYPGIEKNGFREWHNNIQKVRNGFIGIFINILGRFVGNGNYFLIPVVVILVALGIILFFVSSSVMAPFIYTLF